MPMIQDKDTHLYHSTLRATQEAQRKRNQLAMLERTKIDNSQEQEKPEESVPLEDIPVNNLNWLDKLLGEFKKRNNIPRERTHGWLKPLSSNEHVEIWTNGGEIN